MFRLVLLLLLPTALLASNYRSYGHHKNPGGYNDDAQNRDFVHNGYKPGSNIVFNFEQLRRDQPPQIEMRDESPGLYMHRRPQTTTTFAPMPENNRFHENKRFENNDPFSRFSNSPASVNSGRYQDSTPNYNQYNPSPSYSTPMPSPPPAPKWSDFSETFNKPAFPHTDYRRNPVPPAYSPSTSAPEYNAQDFSYMRKNTESSRQQQNTANRGSHKFDWNDLVTEPSWSHTAQQVSSTSAPAAHGTNPHPMPTLSPWIDGFGK